MGMRQTLEGMGMRQQALKGMGMGYELVVCRMWAISMVSQKQLLLTCLIQVIQNQLAQLYTH